MDKREKRGVNAQAARSGGGVAGWEPQALQLFAWVKNDIITHKPYQKFDILFHLVHKYINVI